jgi:hypothetical protein
MDALFQDLRYAVRNLLRNPGFAALTTLCLALGIGVNSTIFSCIDTVAIRPLPFRDPQALVSLHTTQAANGTNRGGVGGVSYLDFRDWKEQTRSFSTLAALSGRSLTVTDRDESERFLGAIVTWDLFPTLGVDPILGRHFREDEDRPGAPPVVMLSHGVWERKFLGDRSIIDRSIMVNGVLRTVVGVMPERFQFPQLAQLWLPLTPFEYNASRSNRSMLVFGRLKESVSLDEARRDIGTVAGRLRASYREHEGWSATAITLRDELMPADVQLIVATMMGQCRWCCSLPAPTSPTFSWHAQPRGSARSRCAPPSGPDAGASYGSC